MKIIEYIKLLNRYLSGELTAEQFIFCFNSVFTNEHKNMDKALFEILEDLFEDGEAYSPLWTPEDENDFRITEVTFRKEVVDAQVHLRRLLRDNNIDFSPENGAPNKEKISD